MEVESFQIFWDPQAGNSSHHVWSAKAGSPLVTKWVFGSTEEATPQGLRQQAAHGVSDTARSLTMEGFKDASLLGYQWKILINTKQQNQMNAVVFDVKGYIEAAHQLERLFGPNVWEQKLSALPSVLVTCHFNLLLNENKTFMSMIQRQLCFLCCCCCAPGWCTCGFECFSN